MSTVHAAPRPPAEVRPFPAPNCRPWCRHDHAATAADDAQYGLTVCAAEAVKLPLECIEDVVRYRRIVLAINQVHEANGVSFLPTISLLGDSYDEPITPADARRLAAELIKAADVAEQTAEVTQ